MFINTRTFKPKQPIKITCTLRELKRLYKLGQTTIVLKDEFIKDMLQFSLTEQQTHKKEEINLILQHTHKRPIRVHELELLSYDTSNGMKGYHLITVTFRSIYKDYMKDEPVDFFANVETTSNEEI